MKKKLLLIKKPHDFERKHRKMLCNSQILQNLYFGTLNCKSKFHKNLFCNEFFLQGNPTCIFIYSIYIFICSIYIYIKLYILYMIYIIYKIYMYIMYVYIYNIYIYIYIYIYITKKTQSQYWVLMGLAPWMNKFESKQIKFNLTTKILLINNYRI